MLVSMSVLHRSIIIAVVVVIVIIMCVYMCVCIHM